MIKTLNIKSRARTEFIDITEDVQQIIRESGITSGMCIVYTPHTTAGLTINEGADPSVKRDIITALNKMVPFDGDYQHAEGNSAAHIKCLLTGVSLNLIIEGGKLELGTWQSLYFCEYDGPRHRRVIVKIV
ncbi:MAG: secondary thiamine-phosphate synthase enzyme YjbQ [Nitrospiraceae bacterium]|nr:secondary thiamine-phosphate synthase enzyme YjbQ [Nitrospiraceae bacterium]